MREKARALVFQVLSGHGVEVASKLMLGRDKVFVVADWSSGPLKAMGVDLADVKREHVKEAYSRGRRDTLDGAKNQTVQMAWSAIRDAKSSCQGKKSRLKWSEHPMVHEAIHATVPTRCASPREIRERLIETHNLLQLGKGLEVRDSPDLGCPGLFLTTRVDGGVFLTFYDGPAILCDLREHAKHEGREGWFIAAGLSSANSAVFVGFKSSDAEITENAPHAGLMSLTNSSRDAANCQRVNIWSPISVDGRFLSETIMLMTRRAIRASPDAPVELVWDYCVR